MTDRPAWWRCCLTRVQGINTINSSAYVWISIDVSSPNRAQLTARGWKAMCTNPSSVRSWLACGACSVDYCHSRAVFSTCVQHCCEQ
jgi:hypothetical protein